MAEPESLPIAEIVEVDDGLAELAELDGDDLEDFRNLPDTTDPRIAKIVQYRLDGKTWEEIAAALGITPRTIWSIRHKHHLDDFVLQAVQDAMDSAKRSFVSLTRKTEQRLHELLDSQEKGDRQWAIDRILNMQARVTGDAGPRVKVPDPPVNPPPRRRQPILPAKTPTAIVEEQAPGQAQGRSESQQPNVDAVQGDTRADVIRRAGEAAKRRAERS